MILGITGNIASGKSQVAEMFVRFGATRVDADQLAREVVQPGSDTLACLVDRFGRGILRPDGNLDRKKLGEHIFTDPKARQDLNRIIHPAIAELATRQLQELRSKPDIPLVVYEAPLLFEAGAKRRVDKVLVVKVSEEVQLQRLRARDGLSETEARNRMVTQMSQQDKLAGADFVIDNSGSLEQLKTQVEALWKRLVRC